MKQARTFRFAYPPAHIFALLLVVTIALAHSVYTYRSVAMLTARADVIGNPWPYVVSMFGLSVVLSVFVSGAVLRRSRLQLTVTEDSFCLERLHWRAGERRIELPWSEVTELRISRTPRRVWLLSLPRGRRWLRLPLSHASEEGVGRLRPPVDFDSAREHPLLSVLAGKLGERLRFDR